jgi:hypothetical protein
MATSNVIVVVGPGLIGQAIARRVGVGKRATPVEELLDLPFLQPDQVADSLHAYQIAKRGNSLRVMAEAFAGASAARESTRSAPASSSPRWQETSSLGLGERATGT